jgi:hypothetical protein
VRHRRLLEDPALSAYDAGAIERLTQNDFELNRVWRWLAPDKLRTFVVAALQAYELAKLSRTQLLSFFVVSARALECGNIALSRHRKSPIRHDDGSAMSRSKHNSPQ